MLLFLIKLARIFGAALKVLRAVAGVAVVTHGMHKWVQTRRIA